jgi:L-asparaginase
VGEAFGAQRMRYKGAVARVLVIHTGGTLMMRPPDAQGEGTAPLSPSAYGRDLVAELPVLERVSAIETKILFNLDSGEMQPMHWVALAREVHAAVATGAYDGIVVVHGTDTMAFTASALALLLGPLPCPVVLTGSQRPLVDVRTDARANLVDAVHVATLPVPEVQIAFASRALRGARATKHDAWAFDAFASPNCPPLVELGLGAFVERHVRTAGVLQPFDDRLEPRVLAVRVFPGLDPALVRGALRVGVKGLVLEAYGTGNFPRLHGSIIPVLDEARERGVPVLVVSQCVRGFVDMERYEGGAAAAAAGAISGGDMTVEAAIAKLMIGLARHPEPHALRAYLERDVIGERTEDPSRTPRKDLP